ncbi:MAG: flavodoxin family protein [Armatimonadetes bacterium]|nr:flavodoxin family protein [Armatimonadota bacterium]
MKVFAILGSRNPEGQTARATAALIEGIAAAGGDAQQAFLPLLQVERCRQCEENGWGICRREGRCVIEDDFAALAQRIREADAVVFSNPVYYSDLSESLRAFTDRLRRVCAHESGRQGIADKPAIGICVAGGGGGGAPAAIVTLEKVMRSCRLDVVDLIPVRRQNLAMKETVLRVTGRWFAEDRK